MERKKVLLLFLLLDIAHATVGIYAKDFSLECYMYRSKVSELIPESPFVLAAFLRDMGYDAYVFTDTTELERFDGVIVLSCTTLTSRDINAFLEFYERGGGLIIDVRKYNPLSEHFGVVKKTYELEGIELGGLSTTYVTVTNGLVIRGAIVSNSGPITHGYERMYYVGEPLYLPTSFNSGFATESGENVLGWLVEGKKRVVVTGCLYCSDPLLLTNLVDWIEDGVVNFPRFTITRKVIPDVPVEGDILVDEIRIITPEEMEVQGEYVYGLTGPFCDFGEPKVEFRGPERIGDRYEIEAVFSYRVEGSGHCLMPPVILTLSSDGKKRETIVDPVEVVVSKKSIVLYREEMPLAVGVLVFLAVIAAVALKPYLRKRYLLREREKYKRLIKLTMKRRMQGEIDDEMFHQMISEYQRKLQEIELELSSDDGKLEKQQSGRPLWPRKGKGRA